MNKKLIAGAGLAALALVGGTFAYFNESLTIDNPLNTGKYDAVMYEDFTPPADDMNPGTHWDKQVGAQNTGDYPVLVRVKMDETWTRKGAGGETYKTLNSDSGTGTTNDLFRDTGNYKGGIFTASQYSVEDHAISAKGDTDGEVPDGNTGNVDHTVIYKNILDQTADPDSKWIDGGDGYWYWNGVLEQNDKTDLLLDGLVMATNIDLGDYDPVEYYHIGEQGDVAEYDSSKAGDGYWTKVDYATETDLNNDGIVDIRDVAMRLGVGVSGNANADKKLFRKSESVINPNALGYSDSTYSLKITSEFVQATQDAVTAAWGETGSTAVGKLDNITTDAKSDGQLVNKSAASVGP